MIRSFVLCILCFVTCSSYAQVRIGLQAGYNSAKWDLTVPEYNWEAKNEAVSGFNVGVTGQTDLKKRIGLQAALLFNSTGTKFRHSYRFHSSSRETRLYSLNLPVVGMYNIDVKQMRFGLGGGMYAAYMLSGTEKGATVQVIPAPNTPPVTTPINNKIEFGSSDEEFVPSNTAPISINRFDAGYVIMTTVEYKRFLVLQASYSAGLTKVLTGSYSFGGNFQNRVVSLSLVVWLSRKG